MWLIVRQLPIKARWWDVPLALRDFSQSNKQNCFVGFPVKILILAVSSLAMNFVETVLHLQWCFENVHIDPWHYYNYYKSFPSGISYISEFRAAANLCNCTCFQYHAIWQHVTKMFKLQLLLFLLLLLLLLLLSHLLVIVQQ